MAIVWDPRATLGIYPDEFGFTCAGTTQKGFRCRNSFIRNQYLLQAGEILDTLSQYHLVWLISDEPRLLATLKTLSWLTLCPRWHQKPGRHNQTLTVTSHWLQVLRSAEKAPRRGWQTSIPTTPSLQLSPTTPTSSSAIHQSQLTAYAAIPSTAPSFLPSYLPAPAASTATSHSRPSCTRSSMLVGTLKPSEPIRQTQAPQFNTGIILSGPIRATGDVTLNITLNSKAGSNITDPPRNSHGHLTPPVSPSQTRTPPCSSPPSPAASVSHRTPLATFSSSVSTSNQAFTHHNIEALLARIDNLEIQLQQVTSRRSSRSSRSSGSSFSTAMFTPISSAKNSDPVNFYRHIYLAINNDTFDFRTIFTRTIHHATFAKLFTSDSIGVVERQPSSHTYTSIYLASNNDANEFHIIVTNASHLTASAKSFT
ncbi:uncharacterized protein RCO7_09539 [Rhynchosporium graminicola]|uniref:Uncharacterized protein n=1 Tax=Rhynchosporium graminicola TaxID=2792576 RepID=A0A1E1K647_9HELO|nr:uncharacterized protein RCO7_09539 [Rhynchosporium commune]